VLCGKICLLKSNWQRHGVSVAKNPNQDFFKVTGSATRLSLIFFTAVDSFQTQLQSVNH
jgi:hypothetical protein